MRSTLLRLMGADSLDATPSDLIEVAPARGRFGTVRGLGFQVRDGGRFFFWTGKRDQALAVLVDQRFPVRTEERSEKDW